MLSVAGLTRLVSAIATTRRRTTRTMATMVTMASPSPGTKKEGDISDSFASMSGPGEPLPNRFRELKLSLVAGREEQVQSSWRRLLRVLKEENGVVARLGSASIPVIHYDSLGHDLERLQGEIRKRGVAVVRGVIPEDEARAYKTEIEAYVARNPSTRGFPAQNRQVFELYWSAPQLKARSHPNLARVHEALMQKLWRVSPAAGGALIDTSQPLVYADRLRIRQPGDARFALGAHMDGGSVERWERDGYGGVYDAVFAGQWGEAYDPWDATGRIDAVSDLYGGLGACTAFRMFQGWLSMSRTGAGEGTLLVNPLLAPATAYTLLRPFFTPRSPRQQPAPDHGVGSQQFLTPDNWAFTAGDAMTPELPGATPGHGQEFSAALHPHLELHRTMVHVPDVSPGDYVVWHCDTIHAVDPVHRGASDSSVLYIPVCPVTEANARYLASQRAAFLTGTPGPDFPGGPGEADHDDRPGAGAIPNEAGLRAMGLRRLQSPPLSASAGAREVVRRANLILGF